MSPDDRRPFRGAPFDRGRTDRAPGPAPERGERPLDRPGFAGPRNAPFTRPATRGGEMTPPDHSVHIRDGEREIEVRGNPAFVRQVLDDLPALMERLRGQAPGRTSISMPPPPREARPPTPVPPPSDAGASADADGNGTAPADRAPASSTLEDRIVEVLRGSGRPLAVAAIRQRLDGVELTGQQVRRALERAGARVVVSSERPATYSLR